MDAGPLWRQLILQIVLILINAFFAATEIAFVSLNDNKVRHMAEEGNKKAKKLLPLIESPTNFLSTIQIGITFAGFLGSAFAADYFADIIAPKLESLMGLAAGSMQAVSVIVVTIVLSYFTLVLGELVPKRLAMKYYEPIAFGVAGIIRFLSVVLRPIIWFVSVSTDLIGRIFGVKPGADEENVTEEEIRMLVDAGNEMGFIEESQKEMINNIFEFDDTTAGEVMTHRTEIVGVEKDAKISEVVYLAINEGFSRLPVYEKDMDNIIGLIYVKDLLCLVGCNSSEDFKVSDFVRPVMYVPESVKCRVLFAEFKKQKAHLAVVVDEYGGMSGIVTMEDLLEEIVGNIYDEFDPQDEGEIQPLGQDEWRISGSAARAASIP